MSLGTVPIPTQSEQGSQQRITNNNIFHSFSGRIHTYRKIHFATWVFFILTLKKKKNREGRLKSGIKHLNQRRNSIIHERTTAYSYFTSRTIPGPWKCIFNWNEDSNIFHMSNFHCCQCLYGEGDGTPLQYSCLENPMDRGAWQAAVHGVSKTQPRLSDFTFTFHFHPLEKEMATHSSVLAWRIPGMAEPGGLLSTGSDRVGHD